VVRDVDVKQFAALVAEHHEDEQEAEAQGWHEEEVDADDVSGMRGQKHAPGWGGPRCRPVHVLGDGQLGDLVAKQGQFRLDTPAPRVGFSRAMRRMSWRSSAWSRGRPTGFGLDFYRQ
jgi:hypothetical protein